MSRSQRRVSAYHDGQLHGLSRWWLESQLRRSPELRRELADLERLAGLLRELTDDPSGGESAPMDEIWPGIASRLSAVDSRRRLEAASQTDGRDAGWSWLRWPSLVVGAAAAVALAIALAPQLARQTLPLPSEAAASGALRYLDTGGRPVMVSEGRRETTIIWLMEPTRDAA
jgi:anti-sigma-K factor RskA